MEIWYSNILNIPENIYLDNVITDFPQIEKERILKFKNQSDKWLSALGIKMVKEKLGN